MATMASSTLGTEMDQQIEIPYMDEPEMPYFLGAQFTIYRHVPPDPLRPGITTNDREQREEFKGGLTQLEHCLRNPPHRGQTLKDDSFVITIKRGISARWGRGAQLFEVLVPGIKMEVVAKIYDSLYYPEPMEYDLYLRPAGCANYHYTHEAAAYQHLNERLGGGLIPSYFGSFTCNIATPDGGAREVRLILIERLRGTCLDRVRDPRKRYTQEQRQNIVARWIDAESAIWCYGISHRDLEPRNIMICGNPSDESFRLVVFDFGHSRVIDAPIARGDNGYDDPRGRPISPILRWCDFGRRNGSHEFRQKGFLDWEWQPWLEQTYKDSQKYAPITPKLEEWYLPECAEDSDSTDSSD